MFREIGHKLGHETNKGLKHARSSKVVGGFGTEPEAESKRSVPSQQVAYPACLAADGLQVLAPGFAGMDIQTVG